MSADYEEYLTPANKKYLLYRFAFTGKGDAFSKKLRYLEKLSEKGEVWRFRDPNSITGEVNVLFNYIIHTFDRCYHQGKISIAEDKKSAAFNTGLLTDAGEEIFGVFSVFKYYDKDDPSKNYWYFKGFFTESNHDYHDLELDYPEMATYFDKYEELYFDPTLEISINYDHILKDNKERLPPEMQQLEEDVAASMLRGSFGTACMRIRRNNRIPVPQFYKGKIMFLIPIKTLGDTPIILALEKYDKRYRVNTVLTFSMAYNNARLLTRPESNWLLPK